MPFVEFEPKADDNICPPDGPTNAKIAIIGEAPGTSEMQSNPRKPFVGPAGTVLERCLHSAGLIRAEVYITNFVKEHPYKNNITPFFSEKTGFSDKGKDWQVKLLDELSSIDAEVLVPMGNSAMCAVLGYNKEFDKILAARGYVHKSPYKELEGKWIVPSIHPAATIRGKFVWQFYIKHDLLKAKRIAYEGYKVPIRNILMFAPKVQASISTSIDDSISNLPQGINVEFIEFEDLIKTLHCIYRYAEQTSIDIETSNHEVSCISIATSPDFIVEIDLSDISIPEEQEVVIWSWIAKILGKERIKKIGQNFIFDTHFMLYKNKIHTKGKIYDTMIGHSILYPDFEKSLRFLGSLYSDQPNWKSMVKFNNIKKES